MKKIELAKALLIACLTFTCATAYSDEASTSDQIESVFTLWKKGSFTRFIVEKYTDYSAFNKVIVLPLKYDDLEIDTGKNVRLTRNWENFIEKDMPSLADRFARVATKKFDEEDKLLLTEKGGSDVLLISVALIKLEPRTFRDGSLSTVGTENFETVGMLDYQLVVMSSAGGIVLAMIEDRIQVSLRKKQLNTRNNHVRAWARTFEYILENFNDDMSKLSKKSPLSKR